jgi:hypothetical protein
MLGQISVGDLGQNYSGGNTGIRFHGCRLAANDLGINLDPLVRPWNYFLSSNFGRRWVSKLPISPSDIRNC